MSYIEGFLAYVWSYCLLEGMETKKHLQRKGALLLQRAPQLNSKPDAIMPDKDKK